jgi:hypothetical protein
MRIVIVVTFRELFAREFLSGIEVRGDQVVLAAMIESTNSWTRIVGLSGFATNFWRTLYAAI